MYTIDLRNLVETPCCYVLHSHLHWSKRIHVLFHEVNTILRNTFAMFVVLYTLFPFAVKFVFFLMLFHLRRLIFNDGFQLKHLLVVVENRFKWLYC